MESSDPVDAPMDEKSKLDEDTQGKAVDPTHYCGMIGTLMYLTASRPDLTFADSSVALTAYANADHVGCQDTRRRVYEESFSRHGCMDMGKLIQFQAYNNGSRKSKEMKDPTGRTGFQDKENQKTSSLWQVLWKTLFLLDSDESWVTYTEVSCPFEDLSDIGSPRANDHEYLELPGMPEPPSPDYVPGLENVDDEIVGEDQPYAEDASPTAQSPDYVPESDPEADPEEDDDKDPEEDPVDYPADGGDDGDDEEGSSEDDEDDDMDIEADDEEEEEHPAPADSVVVALPATDQAPYVEETESFETDESEATPPPHPAYRVTARISIPAPVPIPAWSDAEVTRLLAISTPPSSPLSLWSSQLPQIPSPSLPLSPPSLVLSPAPPPSPIRSLGYQSAMIQMRAEAASTSHSLSLPLSFILSPTRSDAPSLGIPPPLPISVPTLSPPLLLPSASRREDRPEVTLPPQKRLGVTLGPGYEVRESSSAAAARPARGLSTDYGFLATMDREIRRDPEREVGYGITDSWDEIVVTLQGAPVSTDTELCRHMTAFEARVRQDTDEIYTRWRQRLDCPERLGGDRWMGQAVTSEMLKADHRRSAEMRELRTADRTRQQQLIQTLTVMQSLQREAMIDHGVTAALVARDANRNGDDSHTSGRGGKRTERIVRECTYQDFMKCKPLYFKGTEGVVELIQWFERMETVFGISKCSVENQIKFSTCTLLAGALTWWNSHVLSDSHDGTDVIGYNQRFQELALLCVRMFPEESDKIERYVGGLPDMIHGNIVASKPKTMQEAVEMATELMDKKVSTIAERQDYTAGTSEKKPYEGSKPLCAKCNYHPTVRVLQNATNATKLAILLVTVGVREMPTMLTIRGELGSGQKPTCFEYGVQGHFKRECPKLKNNKNRRNQVGNDRAPAKVYAVGHAWTDPDSNVVMGMFLLNNRYASIIFYTGADRSFVSTAFSSQMDITPSTLDHYYDIELADGRIIRLNTILRGCTLNLLHYLFNINLMPVELGSFDAIIGMDWLAKYQAIIVCAEKIVLPGHVIDNEGSQSDWCTAQLLLQQLKSCFLFITPLKLDLLLGELGHRFGDDQAHPEEGQV
ncbi:putative reverse transcriptase domain-containing protein [Tanacetum coccineum]